MDGAGRKHLRWSDGRIRRRMCWTRAGCYFYPSYTIAKDWLIVRE
jgi:hypothetical protein